MESSSVPPDADFIIVGGGTAGLVLANRLSENRNLHILVLESGQNRSNDPRAQDPVNWSPLLGSDMDWKLKSVPQPGLDNRVEPQPQGKALGGSSTINSLSFITPSRAVIDAWTTLGNPKWTWGSFLPYFKKCYTLHPPDPRTCKNLGLNPVDDTKRGDSGPIQVSYPSIAKENPLVRAWSDVFKEMGYKSTADMYSEKLMGSFIETSSVDPRTGHRSSSNTGYGIPASNRPNVTILTEATVQKLLFKGTSPSVIVTGVDASIGGKAFTIKATKEIILCAGAFHTPKLLELSGVGDKDLLAAHQIPLVIENSGVGENLQNHLLVLLNLVFNKDVKVEKGSQALAFTRLRDNSEKELLDKHPPTPQDKNHHNAIRAIIESPDKASCCMFLRISPANLSCMGLILGLPFSRGNTHISSKNPDEKPKVDPRLLSNDLDLEIIARHLQTLVKLPSSGALRPFFKQASLPSIKDLESAKKHVRNIAKGMQHTCGTAAMLPKEQGGVVDQDLVVYGTKNLRVVDASIFPLIPETYPIATLYAVAEKAADLIKGRYM